jgi:hypothetical protein
MFNLSSNSSFNTPSQEGFGLSSIRLQQNYASVVGVKRVITTIPARKPNNQTFVRVRRGEEWRILAAILQLKQDGENYLVLPHLYVDLAQEIRPKILYTAITHDGNPFIWPVNAPGEDGRLDAWSQSAHTAAQAAEKNWIRLAANRENGAYDIYEALNVATEEPDWPDISFEQMLNISFRDRVIDSLDHPIIRRLKGDL